MLHAGLFRSLCCRYSELSAILYSRSVDVEGVARKFDAGVFDISFVNRSDSDNSDSTNITGYIFRVEGNITEIYFVAQVVKIISGSVSIASPRREWVNFH